MTLGEFAAIAAGVACALAVAASVLDLADWRLLGIARWHRSRMQSWK